MSGGMSEIAKINWALERSARETLRDHLREFGPNLDIYGWFPGSREDEKTVHRWFAEHRIEREWFSKDAVERWFRRFDGGLLYVGTMLPPEGATA